MFIVTAHVPRRKLKTGAILVLCCCLVMATALLLTGNGKTVTTSSVMGPIKTDDDRIHYLNQLGWTVSDSPCLTEELLIPDSFDDSYTEYLSLQAKQGFDLTQHCGKRVKRYTYTLLNYPDKSCEVQAALIIYKGTVIGGQLQAADGSFLLPLSG